MKTVRLSLLKLTLAQIFSDKKVTIEDILKEKGQYLRKGRIGEDGDVEFYDDSNPMS